MHIWHAIGNIIHVCSERQTIGLCVCIYWSRHMICRRCQVGPGTGTDIWRKISQARHFIYNTNICESLKKFSTVPLRLLDSDLLKKTYCISDYFIGYFDKLVPQNIAICNHTFSLFFPNRKRWARYFAQDALRDFPVGKLMKNNRKNINNNKTVDFSRLPSSLRLHHM